MVGHPLKGPVPLDDLVDMDNSGMFGRSRGWRYSTTKSLWPRCHGQSAPILHVSVVKGSMTELASTA